MRCSADAQTPLNCNEEISCPNNINLDKLQRIIILPKDLEGLNLLIL